MFAVLSFPRRIKPRLPAVTLIIPRRESLTRRRDMSRCRPADSGAVINDGILEATTSVSRNGYITLAAGDIQLGQGSTIAISPDSSAETIPQDPTSLADFKPSGIDIGTVNSRIEIQQNAMIYAPSGNITIGADPGPNTSGGSEHRRNFAHLRRYRSDHRRGRPAECDNSRHRATPLKSVPLRRIRCRTTPTIATRS